MSPKRKRSSRKEEFRKALTAPHALSEKRGREADAVSGKGCSKLMVSGISTNKTQLSVLPEGCWQRGCVSPATPVAASSQGCSYWGEPPPHLLRAMPGPQHYFQIKFPLSLFNAVRPLILAEPTHPSSLETGACRKGPCSWSHWSLMSLGSCPAPPVTASVLPLPMQSPCCLAGVGFSPFPYQRHEQHLIGNEEISLGTTCRAGLGEDLQIFRPSCTVGFVGNRLWGAGREGCCRYVTCSIRMFGVLTESTTYLIIIHYLGPIQLGRCRLLTQMK